MCSVSLVGLGKIMHHGFFAKGLQKCFLAYSDLPGCQLQVARASTKSEREQPRGAQDCVICECR